MPRMLVQEGRVPRAVTVTEVEIYVSRTPRLVTVGELRAEHLTQFSGEYSHTIFLKKIESLRDEIANNLRAFTHESNTCPHPKSITWF